MTKARKGKNENVIADASAADVQASVRNLELPLEQLSEDDNVVVVPNSGSDYPARTRSAEAAAVGASIASSVQKAPQDKHLEAIGSKLPRRSFISDMPDRGLFAVFTLAVSALIFGAKLTGLNAEYVAGFAVTAMIVYGIVAYKMPRVAMRADRLGDNFYYMGFVFTLSSMAVALIQLGRGVSVYALLGSFGIALATTMVGIAGRVVFVQMRTELDDVEEKIRRELVVAGEQLKHQLGAAVRDLEAFRIGTQQALEERLDQTVERYTDVATQQVARLGTAANEVMSRVETAFGANHEHAQRLNAIAQRTVEAADHLLQRIAAINPPPDVLEQKLGGLADKLTASTEAFEAWGRADVERHTALAGLGDQLHQTLGAVSTQFRSLEQHVQLFANAGAAASGLTSSISGLKSEVEEFTLAIATQSNQLAHGAEAASQARARLEEDLEASRQAVLRVQHAMAETADVVTSFLNPVPSR